MHYLKFVIIALGAIASGVAVSAGMLDIGTHGYILLAACVIPLALGALGAAVLKGFPRWAAILSLLSFLVAGMKSSGYEPLAGTMIAAFVGILVSLVLAIKPDRGPAAPRP